MASRRLLAPRAIRPIRAFNRYEDIPGRKLAQNKGIKYRLDNGDEWATCTIQPIATSVQRNDPAWYNVISPDGETSSLKLTDQTDWQVWRNGSWWSSGNTNMPEPDSA